MLFMYMLSHSWFQSKSAPSKMEMYSYTHCDFFTSNKHGSCMHTLFYTHTAISSRLTSVRELYNILTIWKTWTLHLRHTDLWRFVFVPHGGQQGVNRHGHWPGLQKSIHQPIPGVPAMEDTPTGRHVPIRYMNCSSIWHPVRGQDSEDAYKYAHSQTHL